MFQGHLRDTLEKGVFFVPIEQTPDWPRLSSLEVTLDCEEMSPEGVVPLTFKGELLQILAGNGLVLRLLDPGVLRKVLEENRSSGFEYKGAESSRGGKDFNIDRYSELCVKVFHGDESTGEKETTKRSGITPLSWTIEELRSGWSNLTQAEKIRVARYGGRNVRRIIIKGAEKQLHGHVLSNPKITPEEVAAMAAEAALDPLVLKRIAGSSEWTQHKRVVKNLIKNPKLPLPKVRSLLSRLGPQDLRELRKSEKLRASVREILKKRLTKL